MVNLLQVGPMLIIKLIGLTAIVVMLMELFLRQRHHEWTINRDPNMKPTSARFYDFEKISKIEPNINSDYLTRHFWTEMQTLTRDRSGLKMTNASGGKYLVAKNCAGQFFSVEGNLRKTSFEPISTQHNFYLFGSSTLHNFEVPDEMTTASNVQKIFSESNTGFKVINYGVSGATIENNFARMQAIEKQFNSGDVIVILFGINDVGLDTYPSYEVLTLKVLRRLGDISLLVRTIHRQLAKKSWKTHATATAKAKTDLINEINVWASQRDIGFKAILEPVLHFKKNPNKYETELRKSFGRKLDFLYMFGYQEFINLHDPENTSSAIDIFDQTEISVFLDQAHINAVGTKLLAAEIVKLSAFCLK